MYVVGFPFVTLNGSFHFASAFESLKDLWGRQNVEQRHTADQTLQETSHKTARIKDEHCCVMSVMSKKVMRKKKKKTMFGLRKGGTSVWLVPQRWKNQPVSCLCISWS